MNSDSIDIVISVYNGASYLEEQIISLMGQDYKKINILVRDDDSTDNSIDIIKKIHKNFPDKIKIVVEDSGRIGPIQSFSKLLSRCESNYLMLCDQDDIWLPYKISKTLSSMHAAEQRYGSTIPILVHTDLNVVDKELSQIAPSFFKYQNLNPRLGMKLNRQMVQNVVTGCTVMINRPLANLALPIPENAVMHDRWLALVAALFGHVVYLDEATILYRQHSENSVGANRWGVRRVMHQARSIEAAHKSIIRSSRQAQELLHRYRDLMTHEQYSVVEACAQLPYMSKTQRIATMVKYNFYKHGFIRIAGFCANLITLDRYQITT